ncbi:hypothetical protein Emag_000087 [Eimeria magna]
MYPSTAQFFRALQRKGKDADSSSMPAVVYVHNFVNEQTWKKIQQLEKQHPFIKASLRASTSHSSSAAAASAASAAASAASAASAAAASAASAAVAAAETTNLNVQRQQQQQEQEQQQQQEEDKSVCVFLRCIDSWGSLFDRHDWYVDRCGKQVRYIIDFYDDPQAGNEAEVYVHARPAPFDSLENFKDVEGREALALDSRFSSAAAADVLLHAASIYAACNMRYWIALRLRTEEPPPTPPAASAARAAAEAAAAAAAEAAAREIRG